MTPCHTHTLKTKIIYGSGATVVIVLVTFKKNRQIGIKANLSTCQKMFALLSKENKNNKQIK